MSASTTSAIDPLRVRARNARAISPGPVLYWMSRDQRLSDNWAALYALEQANQLRQPLVIAFVLMPQLSHASRTHYQWMLQGLQQMHDQAQALGIGCVVQVGNPVAQIGQLAQHLQAGLIVTDMSPLRSARADRQQIAQLPVAVHEVDAHNIVPVWLASDRAEHAAYTLRPKLHKQLDRWLVDIPPLSPPLVAAKPEVRSPSQSLTALLSHSSLVATEATLQPRLALSSGEQAGREQLASFLSQRLPTYAQQRNNPAQAATSGLSPYLHFGQLSAQRVALAVQQSQHSQTESAQVFLEELMVRRELADNYCYYTPEYDSVQAFPAWARATLRDHEADARLHSYSLEQLEQAQTHDQLWNTAQTEMLKTGTMHGYLRMYWAKQLLRWTPNAERALELGMYLNDRYHLDGRDPNGYAGLAWALGGVHDRPWPAQPIFGTVRSMSFASTSKKFDFAAYQQRIAQLSPA